MYPRIPRKSCAAACLAGVCPGPSASAPASTGATAAAAAAAAEGVAAFCPAHRPAPPTRWEATACGASALHHAGVASRRRRVALASRRVAAQHGASLATRASRRVEVCRAGACADAGGTGRRHGRVWPAVARVRRELQLELAALQQAVARAELADVLRGALRARGSTSDNVHMSLLPAYLFKPPLTVSRMTSVYAQLSCD